MRFLLYIYILLSLVGSLQLSAQSSDGEVIRIFARDLIQATAISPQEQAAPRLREAVIHNEAAVRVLMRRNDYRQLFKEAGIEPNTIVLGEKQIPVNQLLSLTEQLKPRINLSFSTSQLQHAVNITIHEYMAQTFVKATNNSIENMDLSKQPALQKILDPMSGIQLQTAELNQLFREVLPHYFQSLPTTEKKRIAYAILSLPPHTAEIEQLEAVLQTSGPFIQKAFQLLKDRVSDPSVANILSRLQSKVRPYSFEEIRPVVEKNIGPLQNTFKSFQQEALASGTIGQIHLAILHNGQEVVVKVRRPFVQERLQLDYQLIRALAKAENVRELITKMYNTFQHEMNFLDEAKNLREGEIYISAKRGITLAKLVADVPATQEVLVIERAEGEVMSDFSKDSIATLTAKGASLSRLSDLWFRNALFETGFFHGDLHGGNLFFKESLDKRAQDLLTVIDFGNAHRLTLTQQRGFIKLAVACVLGTETAAVHGIQEILQLPDSEHPRLLENIRHSFEMARSISDRITLTVLNLEKANYPLPESFVSFAKARMYIDQAITRINEEIARKGGKTRFNQMNNLLWGTFKQMFTQLPWKQKVLNFYFLGELTTQNCHQMVDRMNFKLPGQHWQHWQHYHLP